MNFRGIAAMISSVLTVTSTISGVIAVGQSGEHKGLFLSATVMSLLAAIFLILFYIFGRSEKHPGMLMVGIISLSTLLLLISGSLYATAAVKLSKSDSSGKTAATISSVMTAIAVMISGVLLIVELVSRRKKVIQTRPDTQVVQQVPYTNPAGAQDQLSHLQTRQAQPQPQRPSQRPTGSVLPSRRLNPQVTAFVPQRQPVATATSVQYTGQL